MSDVTDELEGLSRPQLYKRLYDLMGRNGLFWFTNVVKAGGGSIHNFTPEFMTSVCRDPDVYFARGSRR
jgi:hypothetical protein